MPKRSPGSHTVDDINKRFGRRLRMNREMSGRSQTEVGGALGVSFQQVQKYENGTTSISLNRLSDAASFLKVPLRNLLEGLDGASSGQTTGRVNGMATGMAEAEQTPFEDDDATRTGFEPVHLNREKVQLLNAFNRIDSQRVRRSILSLTESLAAGAASETEPDDNDDA